MKHASAAFLVNQPGGYPLGQLPAHHAARDPKRPVITFDGKSVSRAEFEARANRRARMLAALGVKAGDFVTLALPNSIAFYETSFAIWKLGAVPNIVASKLPDHELGAILQIVSPSLVVGIEPARTGGHATLSADVALDESLSAEPLPEAVAPYWKAMTSGGSTGRPKVIVDHMPGLWDPNAPAIGQVVDDTLLNPGPLYHNAPFLGMHYGLFAGAHVVDMGKFDPARALTLIEEHRIAWVNLVPTMMHRIWRLPPELREKTDVSSLRVVFHMAAPCPAWLKELWIGWLGPERMFELYGGTERTGATIIRGDEWLAHKGSVGQVQAGSKIRILNEQGEDCVPGEVGEIYFLPDAGRNATYHYMGAEARTLGEWESLGDLGYFDKDNYLYLVDRRTDLILSGGANIYPAEVEAALDAHPEVLSSIVVGLPDDEWGARVHAIVQRAPGSTLTEAALIAAAGERIARYKLPKTVEFVDHPLRDDAGKSRRSALRDERIVTRT